MSDAGHRPVVVKEVLDLLDPQLGETLVDCTVGLGGHAAAIAERLGPAGTVIGFDLDPGNLAAASRRFQGDNDADSPGLGRGNRPDDTPPRHDETPPRPRPGPCEFVPIHDSFAAIARHLTERDIRANLVLADLGFSSNQMEDSERGFSFNREGPLDMRLNPEQETTAADLVNTLNEGELADVIYQYGEEPLSRKIARIVAQNRQVEPIRTTARLAELVLEAYGRRASRSRMHPATRTFMALRIAVNDELGALRSLLDCVTRAAERISKGGETWLASGARIGIIAFHSLEDRLVKHCFADMHKRSLATRLTKRPVTCSEQEAKSNPRARSAKLRVVRIDDRRNRESA